VIGGRSVRSGQPGPAPGVVTTGQPPSDAGSAQVPARRRSPLRRSAALVADHAVLWLPGALASLAFLGWLPFLLAVANPPNVGDLAFFAAGLVTAPDYPGNVYLLVAAAALGALSASILVAAGETLLLRTQRRLLGQLPTTRLFDEDLLRVWGSQLIAALPAIAALAALAARIAAVAPGEYQSPDIGGTFLYRVARDVWPLGAAAILAIALGQAWGSAAVRRASAPRARFLSALLWAARDVVRNPLRRVGVALATSAALTTWLVATWALLRLLWHPIGVAIGNGRLTQPVTLVLLLGFVAIWLCLIAGGGALHAWSSAWWTLRSDTAASTVRPVAAEGDDDR
jgi:hypothetical protein